MLIRTLEIGLLSFSHWQIYVVMTAYILITSLPIMFAGFVAGKDKSTSSVMTGCLSQLLIRAFQSAVMYIGILVLFPILTGIGDQAAWHWPKVFLQKHPIQLLKSVEIIWFVCIGVSFIPFIGKSTVVATFLPGILSIAFAANDLNLIAPSLLPKTITYIPNLWISIGYGILFGLAIWIEVIVAGIVVSLIKNPSITIGEVVHHGIGTIIGFIPILIYGAWMGNQFR